MQQKCHRFWHERCSGNYRLFLVRIKRLRVMITFPRVLLIDDDPFWLESLAEYLRRKGFHVMEARDAMEGLERLETEEVSLVISDYNLPDMNGLRLLRHLRHRRRQMAILIISSEDEPSLPNRIVSAGAIAFL